MAAKRIEKPRKRWWVLILCVVVSVERKHNGFV